MTRQKSGTLPGGWVLAAGAAVLLWRLAAWRWPSSMVSIPDNLRLPMALLGVLFVACGVWAWWSRPDRYAGVFLLYCLGAGVHWGGAVGAREELDLGLLFVYLGLSAIAEAAFLHLALIYPDCGPLRRAWRAILYAPAALALLLAPLAGVLPRAMLEPAAGLVLMVANLMSIVAAVVFVVRLVRADPAARRAARLPLIAAAVVGAGVVAMAGSAGVLGGQPDAWNLVLAAIPTCLAIALVSRETPRTA